MQLRAMVSMLLLVGRSMIGGSLTFAVIVYAIIGTFKAMLRTMVEEKHMLGAGSSRRRGGPNQGCSRRRPLSRLSYFQGSPEATAAELGRLASSLSLTIRYGPGADRF